MPEDKEDSKWRLIARLFGLVAEMGLEPDRFADGGGWNPGQKERCIVEMQSMVNRMMAMKEPRINRMFDDAFIILEGVRNGIVSRAMAKSMVDALRDRVDLVTNAINDERERSANPRNRQPDGYLHPGVIFREVNDVSSEPESPTIPAVVTRSAEIMVRTPEGRRRAHVDAEGQLIIGELVDPKVPEPAKEDPGPRSTVIPGRLLRRIDA
jgi:hypothetical protein